MQNTKTNGERQQLQAVKALFPALAVLTLHHQLVCDPTWFLQARMRHQAVQPLPSHAAQRVEGVLAGHGPTLTDAGLELARQVRVPGELWNWAANSSAGGDHAEWLTLQQSHWFQGGNGQN